MDYMDCVDDGYRVQRKICGGSLRSFHGFRILRLFSAPQTVCSKRRICHDLKTTKFTSHLLGDNGYACSQYTF